MEKDKIYEIIHSLDKEINKGNVELLINKINKTLEGINKNIKVDCLTYDFLILNIGFLNYERIKYIKLEKVISEDDRYIFSVKSDNYHIIKSFKKERL